MFLKHSKTLFLVAVRLNNYIFLPAHGYPWGINALEIENDVLYRLPIGASQHLE